MFKGFCRRPYSRSFCLLSLQLKRSHSTSPFLAALTGGPPPTWTASQALAQAKDPATRFDKAWVTVLEGSDADASPDDIRRWITEILGNAVGSTLLGIYPVPPHPKADFSFGRPIILTFSNLIGISQFASFLQQTPPSLANAHAAAVSAPATMASKMLDPCEGGMSDPSPSRPRVSCPSSLSLGQATLKLSRISAHSAAEAYLWSLQKYLRSLNPAVSTSPTEDPTSLAGPFASASSRVLEKLPAPPYSRLAHPYSGRAVLVWGTMEGFSLLDLELGLDGLDWPSFLTAPVPEVSVGRERQPLPFANPSRPEEGISPIRRWPLAGRGVSAFHRSLSGLRWPGYDSRLGMRMPSRNNNQTEAGEGGEDDGDSTKHWRGYFHRKRIAKAPTAFSWHLVYLQTTSDAHALVQRIHRTQPRWAGTSESGRRRIWARVVY